jgi:hypothetical protein
MFPTRAWELLFGGMVALLVHRGTQVNKGLLKALSFAGMAMLLGSLYLVNEKMRVPGIAAAPAIIGTALVIFSGHYQQNFITQSLSIKPLVKIGLVSYSAYLWHWPILAFLRYTMTDINVYVGLAAFVATFVFAFTSYHLVEQPFRKKRLAPPEAIAYVYALPSLLLVTGAFILSGMIAAKSDALYDWKSLANMNSDVKPAYDYYYNCQESNFRQGVVSEARCIYPEGTSPNTLLVGDSHGAHYVGMMRSLASAYGFSFRNATQSACSFVFDPDVSNVMQEYREGCATYRLLMEKEAYKYDNVIIGGIWNSYYVADGEKFKQDFERTIAKLVSMGKKVIVLAQAPLFPSYNLKCMERNFRVNVADCSHRFDEKMEESEIRDFISSLAVKYPKVQVFDPSQYLCPNGVCSPYLNGQPIYFDTTHLSMVGSGVLGNLIARHDTDRLNPFAHLN